MPSESDRIITTDDLLAKMKAIEARAKQRCTQENLPLLSPVTPAPAQVITLPFWPEAVRAVPNGMLRSALFGAIRRGARRYMDRERIAALDSIEIFYTGQRLDQGDLDVWEGVLHIARFQEMGQQYRFTAYAMLKMLGKTDTGGNREVLHKRITRLRANAIELKQGCYAYIGGLIDEAYKDEKTQEYVVSLNPKLHLLFTTDQFTQIDWNIRRALDGHPLAQWLHGFYASHARPYPVSVTKLQELSGSETESLRHFREGLRKALNAVVKANTEHGQPFSYEIRGGDIVHADKTPSRAQHRHLAKKTAKPHRR